MAARRRPDSFQSDVKSQPHQNDIRHDCKINSSAAAAALAVHNHTTQASAKSARAGKRARCKYACTYICMSTRSQHTLTDLVDWQRFVRFSYIYLCTPSDCTSQLCSKLKTLIRHPVQSKFNASNYRGSASRQIWSTEAWQGSLLRIRAF